MTLFIDSSVIQFENVSVNYRLPQIATQSFKDFLIRTVKRENRFINKQALNSLSFTVKNGEVLGFLGENGAGKSTILKLIAQVIVPTQGRVVVKGRVAPLLELGAAFHAELSGRENIYLFGTLLGYSRRLIQSRIDSIIDFSELHDSIDTPFRTYSSGMQMRLGFSIATEIRPDILIIDESLTVGDQHFQGKCLRRVQEFRDAGTTILLVSHSLTTLESFCDRFLWLSQGKLVQFGMAHQVICAYREIST